MSTAAFPSQEFPPVPQVSLEMPIGWDVEVVAGVLLSIAAPEVPEEFRPNVVVSWTRLLEPYDTEDALADVLRQYDGDDAAAEVIGSEDELVDGAPAKGFEVSFIHPVAGSLVQANVVAVVPTTDRIRDVLHVCGSCSASQVEAVYGAVRDAVRSVRINAR